MINVDDLIREFAQLKTKRSAWEKIWDVINKYVMLRKDSFSNRTTTEDFIPPTDVIDITANQALHSMVSSIDGALWKNGGRTFKIVPPRQAPGTKEIKDYYFEINARKDYQMEHEKAKFGTARTEALLEAGAFGTDAIGVFPSDPGSDHKVEYRAMSLKSMYVCVDALGRVYKIFYEVEYNAFQLAKEYGEETVRKIEKVKAALDSKNYEQKFQILWVVRPRDEYKKGAQDMKRFSYESIHILVQDKQVLRESGFSGNPVIVSRFYKREGEDYGRSPGFQAILPAIQLCAILEILEKGGELSALPPIWVTDDGTFGNGVINRSPNAVASIDLTTSRITGSAPMGQMFTVGRIDFLLKLAEYYVEQLRRLFIIDKLTDLDNKTRMTLGEAQIRNELRADSTGSIFSRQIEEKLTPVIRRTIDVLYEAREFGVVKNSPEYVEEVMMKRTPLVIPDALVKLQKAGIEIFNIEYVSPAARILRSEETRGFISLWQFAAGFSQIKPELILWLNDDKAMKIAKDLYGAGEDSLVSPEIFAQRLKALQEQRKRMEQLQAAQVAAEVDNKKASANQQNAQAQATVGGMNGMINNPMAGGASDYAGMIA